MTRVWIGSIPGIYGYGMIVAGKDRATCERSLRAKMQEWLDRSGISGGAPRHLTDLAEALEYFGGAIREVEAGWVYNDNFG
jgi:hypothetical protein